MFPTHNVSEWIWGYNDTMLEGQAFQTLGVSPLTQLFSPDDPDYYSQPSEAYTGKGGNKPGMSAEDSILQMTMWSGKRTLPYWSSPYANMINGTDGTQFKPDIQNSDKLYVYVDSIFRSGELNYQQDVTLNGVTLKRFVIAEEMLEPASQNPDNAAFGMTQRGFLPLPPSMQLPITISKAHFMDCDLSQVNVSIDGHNPPLVDPDLHYIHIDREPLSGAVFCANTRLQLNAFMQPIIYQNMFGSNITINITQNLPTTWFPVTYAYEYGIATEKVCDDFISQVYTPLRIGYYGGIISFVLSALFIVGGGVMFRRQRMNESEEDEPINK
jgi:hypothetical protein